MPDRTTGAEYLALTEDGATIGLCTFTPDERWMDGPGVVPGMRTAERYVRLLRGAFASLGPGGVTVETWGDDRAVIDAYLLLGWEIVEETAGWELRLLDKPLASPCF